MSASKPACIHRALEGNIQEFVLIEISRRALDELFDFTEQNLQAAAVDGNAEAASAVLIDSSIGPQSLNYSLFRLRAMMGRFPNQRKGSIAIIMPSNPLVRTISLMMRSIAPVRIYAPHEREQALAWLREQVSAKR
jgi:hypothetical protein